MSSSAAAGAKTHRLKRKAEVNPDTKDSGESPIPRNKSRKSVATREIGTQTENDPPVLPSTDPAPVISASASASALDSGTCAASAVGLSTAPAVQLDEKLDFAKMFAKRNFWFEVPMGQMEYAQQIDNGTLRIGLKNVSVIVVSNDEYAEFVAHFNLAKVLGKKYGCCTAQET